MLIDKVDEILTTMSLIHPLCLNHKLQSNVKDIHINAIIKHGKTLFL